jgi:hypothetical protein
VLAVALIGGNGIAAAPHVAGGHVSGGQGTRVDRQLSDHRGRAFIGFSRFDTFQREEDHAAGTVTLTSPELAAPIAANEAIASWNADTPAGTGLKIEARAYSGGHYTRYYTLGLWSRDGIAFPRTSVNGQRDADGDVATDTLALNAPLSRIQLRVTLSAPQAGGDVPKLKFLGVSLADTHAQLTPLPANRSVWGKEIEVPGRTQLGWPDASGWCSPTSTSMALAYWSKRLSRAELDVPVPAAAHAIYDKVYAGTGNWPFNTAFAGSFPGIRAYVTRLSDIRELEDWAAAGIPVVVSVSYDLLRGKERDEDPGHLMVCDGFTANGDIVLNDPAHHPERGEACRRVFPRANFLRGWGRSHFVVYLIYPEGTKLPVDTYGHWDSPTP